MIETGPRLAPSLTEEADIACEVVVIGAGACGQVAGLRAMEAGADVVVLERDPVPSGSTAMSSGFVPAPATRFQAVKGIEDDPDVFAADIQKKAAEGADPEIVAAVTHGIGPALEWLADRHGLEWDVLDDFLYPGHSRHRMHAVPERTGAGLIGRLTAASEKAGLTLVPNARVTTLHVDNEKRVTAVTIERPDGSSESIACKALILACNGYGGNADLVARHIPDMAPALYYGHAGNQGDAVLWGEALGAGLADLTACQGHGSLATPHNILITWALMMEGGIQVNTRGERFSNEHGGYSEQAVHVLAQPDRLAWNIYDERLHQLGLGFPDYRDAASAGAIVTADTIAGLATKCGLPPDTLEKTLAGLAQYRDGSTDPFGRDFSGWRDLEPPFHAIRVSGALFHTQGGLSVDRNARVLSTTGMPLPNLYAAGGAARGVSGARIEGYLSGNGLLTAIGLGYIAGHAAAVSVA